MLAQSPIAILLHCLTYVNVHMYMYIISLNIYTLIYFYPKLLLHIKLHSLTPTHYLLQHYPGDRNKSLVVSNLTEFKGQRRCQRPMITQ